MDILGKRLQEDVANGVLFDGFLVQRIRYDAQILQRGRQVDGVFALEITTKSLCSVVPIVWGVRIK